MIIGIPKEGRVVQGFEEKRVALTPAGVRELVRQGVRVFVSADAGTGAGFRAADYRAAGAETAYSNEEVIRRADVVLLVGRPDPSEWSYYNPGTALMGFLRLGTAEASLLRFLSERELTAVGYEAMEEEDGSLPILRTSSEIAGKMAVQLAGRLLENESGGRGILLGGLPGIPPADVVIVGGGTLGYYAARSFLGAGASVYVLDVDLRRLQQLDALFEGRVVTALANQSNLEKHVAFADVLIGSVLDRGRLAPVVVTSAMVQTMQPGSVIIDFSIDHGGCVETSRLWTGGGFLFTEMGVVHFCAPNVPALVARTASHALTNALLPYLVQVARLGLEAALRRSRTLRQGLYLYRGVLSNRLVQPDLASADLETVVHGLD